MLLMIMSLDCIMQGAHLSSKASMVTCSAFRSAFPLQVWGRRAVQFNLPEGPSLLRPKLDSKSGSKNKLKKGPPLQGPLEHLSAPSVGILVKMLLEKGLETRSKRGQKEDSKEEHPQNMENVSSIHYLLRFSHVGRCKEQSFLS